MYQTRNDLPSQTRAIMILLLNARLADAVDLRTQAKVAHWNVKGRQFAALHELFDGVAHAVDEYADLIAERAVQLGGLAEGTARQAAAATDLEEYSALGGTEEHVGSLANALAARVGRAEDDRRGVGRRRPGHSGHLHRGVARDRQVALDGRGPSPDRRGACGDGGAGGTSAVNGGDGSGTASRASPMLARRAGPERAGPRTRRGTP